MPDNYMEIPRIFTSIAEITACLIYISTLKKRKQGVWFALYVIIGIVAITSIQLISGLLSITFWVPGMLLAMMAMFLLIWSTCDLTAYEAGYLFVRAFIVAELAAAFYWQSFYFLLYKGFPFSWSFAFVIMLFIYFPIFLLVYMMDARKENKMKGFRITRKEFFNAVIIGGATFLINNINFVWESPFVSRQVGASILYVRTLVDFSGFLVLYGWSEQRREIYLNHELRAMNDILHKQYEQYQNSKDNMELVHSKYHDLKHQIALIKNEKDPDKKELYLEEIQEVINGYTMLYDTGNSVVDTILTNKGHYCKERDINLSCVVQGDVLSFISAMDICSIFGNALDNAIESVEKLSDLNKKIIRVAVYSKNNFVMLRFENYYEENLIFEEGLPITTKAESSYHGYGIKSIKKTVEKYNGIFSIDTKDHWFVVKILIPIK